MSDSILIPAEYFTDLAQERCECPYCKKGFKAEWFLADIRVLEHCQHYAKMILDEFLVCVEFRVPPPDEQMASIKFD